MSWQQLQGVLREQRKDVTRQLLEPPVACPNDGEPLRSGPQGQLFCPFDGWRPAAGGRAAKDQT